MKKHIQVHVQTQLIQNRDIVEQVRVFFKHLWDNPVAVVGHPGKVEREMFGPPFLSPFSTGGEQCGS